MTEWGAKLGTPYSLLPTPYSISVAVAVLGTSFCASTIVDFNHQLIVHKIHQIRQKLVRIPLLYQEARYHADMQGASYLGSYLIGLAFAFDAERHDTAFFRELYDFVGNRFYVAG